MSEIGVVHFLILAGTTASPPPILDLHIIFFPSLLLLSLFLLSLSGSFKMAVASIGAAVSLHSSQSTSFSAIISPERISFNKVSLYHRNVSSAAGAKVAPIRAQVTTDTPKEPYIGKCLLNTKITGDDAPGETWHMVFSHEGEVPYTEGQSIGIIPEGIDKNGKPHKLRLYSIARSALGDLGDSKTVLGI